MEFTIVERQATGGSEVKEEYVKALIETAESGQAVKITLDPNTNFVNWQSTLRNRLRKHNLRLRAQYTKARREVVAWTEKLD
jgi:hypothetical protein